MPERHSLEQSVFDARADMDRLHRPFGCGGFCGRKFQGRRTPQKGGYHRRDLPAFGKAMLTDADPLDRRRRFAHAVAAANVDADGLPRRTVVIHDSGLFDSWRTGMRFGACV
jgi:hypothetical protein